MKKIERNTKQKSVKRPIHPDFSKGLTCTPSAPRWNWGRSKPRTRGPGQGGPRPKVVGALAVELGRRVIGRAVKAGEAVGGAGVCRAGFGGGRGRLRRGRGGRVLGRWRGAVARVDVVDSLRRRCVVTAVVVVVVTAGVGLAL